MNPEGIAKLITEDPDVPQISQCPFSVDEFDWDRFGDDLEKENQKISSADFGEESDTITRTILLYPKSITKIVHSQEYYDLLEKLNSKDYKPTEYEQELLNFFAIEKVDVVKWAEDSGLLYSSMKKWWEVCPEFCNALQKRIVKACGRRFWEVEESTQPHGWHGTYETITVAAELKNAKVVDIEEIEQDEDGTILHLAIEVPFRTTGWHQESLV